MAMNNGAPVPREVLKELRAQNIGRLLLHAQRAFSATAIEKLRARGHVGLGMAHTAVLPHVDLDGTRITTLAERAGITKQGVGQLVHDLEQLGYLERTTDPTDRRATLITFTPSGWQFLRDAYDVKRELEAEYAAMLGPANFAELRSMLEALIEHGRTDD